MTLNLTLTNDNLLTKVALWTAANPVVTRIALLALPVGVAVAMAAFGHYSLFTLPPTGGGGGGCGGAC